MNLRLEITYQDGEVFVGESMTDAPRAQPTPIWGAIRSTGKQAIFVTSGGGRGNVWFNTPTQFEYCFTNQTQALMAAHCAVLKKVSEG